MDYDVLEIIIIALGFAISYYLLTRINPESYQVEPFMGMVADKLFGGPSAVAGLPPCVPLLYLQQKREGVNGDKYLNVLVPLPSESAVQKRTLEWTGDPGKLTMSLTYEARTNSSAPNAAKELFHETLIPVGWDVATVEVRCSITANGPSGGSGIGTGDSDTEDPIDGGPATPYMSSNVTGPCSLVYNGDDSSAVAIVQNLASGRETTTMDGGAPIQRPTQPVGTVASVSVGDRSISNVYVP